MKLGTAVAVTSIVSLAAGCTAGFLYAKHLLKPQYEELAEKEIAEAKAFYAKANKEKFATPEAAVEVLMPTVAKAALKEYQGRPNEGATPYNKVTPDAEPPPVSETKNIFVQAVDPDHDWERRVRNRTEEAPYVISHDEFFQGELDYKQTTLTYYEGDGVLADERDDTIPEIDETVGDDNIIRFGDHSNDPNVVYIRNDALSIDFEITRSGGKYSEEVAGFGGS